MSYQQETGPATQTSQLTIESCISKLTEAGVVGDVLPSSINLQGLVHVVYPKARATCGEVLAREDTEPEPTIEFTPDVQDPDSMYTIIMTDPDLFKRNDKMSGQVRHWLQRNVKFDASGRSTITEQAVTNYLQCSPGLGTGKHRYTFIVAKQPSIQSQSQSSDSTSPSLSNDTVTSLTSGGPNADLIHRSKFDAWKYIQEAGLEVVGVTYMEVSGNVASTLDDVKLTAQSVAHKVMGN